MGKRRRDNFFGRRHFHFFGFALMRTLPRLLSMYGPLLFLGGLAGLSFWLTPPTETPPQPAYSIALQSANYAQFNPDGALQLSADKMQQKIAGRAELSRPRLRHSFAGGAMHLEGESGAAISEDGGGAILQIQQVRGLMTGGGRRLTLRADSVVYDAAAKQLSGEKPRFSGADGELRGDRFTWDEKNGLIMQGDARGRYVF